MRGGDREPIGVQRRVPNFQRRLVTIVSAGAHDGRIFGSAGDSFMIEFERPFDAVQFAVEARTRERNPSN